MLYVLYIYISLSLVVLVEYLWWFFLSWQNFTQRYDISALRLHTLKDADSEWGHSQGFIWTPPPPPLPHCCALLRRPIRWSWLNIQVSWDLTPPAPEPTNPLRYWRHRPHCGIWEGPPGVVFQPFNCFCGFSKWQQSHRHLGDASRSLASKPEPQHPALQWTLGALKRFCM